VTWNAVDEQEAQLPLRNRASAMHFFLAKLLSIAVVTYSYVYQLRDLFIAKSTLESLCYPTAKIS